MDRTRHPALRPALRPALCLLLLAALWLALPLAAQEPCDCPCPCPCPCPPSEPPPEPLWQVSNGLSYVATTGSSETSSFGFAVDANRRPDPWGIEIFATYDRAEDDDTLQSERTYGGVRGKRSLGDRWEAFAEASAESDEFAGIDPRLVLATGATYNALLGPAHVLDLDAGITWTEVDRLLPDEDDSFLGALLGVDYDWRITDRSAFGQEVAYFPNFDDADDWRLRSLTTLESSISEWLALRLAYEVRFQNQPVGGRDDTDTTTRVSVVVNL